MWQIQNPRKVFSYLDEPTGRKFELICLIPDEKYNSFAVSSKTKIEEIEEIGFSMEDCSIKDPNNPAKLLDCKLIKFCI